MRYLIGLGMIILGGILSAVTGFVPFFIILFVGVFLFASFPDEAIFCDYIIANSENDAILRKRYYMLFLPFTIVSYILTLGNSTLKIVWKEEYFKTSTDSSKEVIATKISRKEYITIRNEQRRIYSSQQLSKEFMEKSYTVEDIGFKHKEARLIAAIIVACLVLTMLTVPEPGAIYMALLYEAVFVPMILLWIPEYKDAKILQQAYEHALGTSNQI